MAEAVDGESLPGMMARPAEDSPHEGEEEMSSKWLHSQWAEEEWSIPTSRGGHDGGPNRHYGTMRGPGAAATGITTASPASQIVLVDWTRTFRPDEVKVT